MPVVSSNMVNKCLKEVLSAIAKIWYNIGGVLEFDGTIRNSIDGRSDFYEN